MITEFFRVLGHYLVEVLPYLAAGFILSGIIHEFIPTRWVERHLGGKGIKPLLYSTVVGSILPICCIGSLPIAVSLYQKGARLGPVLAFLVATPATSITALLVTYALLGIKFTVFIFFAVIMMGLVMGFIGNLIKGKPGTRARQEQQFATDPVCGMNVETDKALKAEHKGEIYHFCCAGCQQTFAANPEAYLQAHPARLSHRLQHVLRYTFIEMPREIGLEIVIGLVLAAVIATVTPVGEFVGDYLSGGWGYPFSLIFGLMMYICSTASVPLVDAFISQGMNIGAGMVMLIVGPITSWGTILVLRKEFGNRTLLIYLTVISALALGLGYIFSLI